MEFLLSVAAKQDVIDLAVYIAEDNPGIGAAVFDDVWQTCVLLSSMPEIGTPIETLLDETEISQDIREILHALPLLKGMRRFPLSKFRKVMIFYKVDQDMLDIVRVIHGSRDIPVLFASMVTE